MSFLFQAMRLSLPRCPSVCIICLLVIGLPLVTDGQTHEYNVTQVYNVTESPDEPADTMDSGGIGVKWVPKPQKVTVVPAGGMEKFQLNTFVDKLFVKYGNGDTMTKEGFEHLLHHLGLGGTLVLADHDHPHDDHDHAHDDHDHAHDDHDHAHDDHDHAHDDHDHAHDDHDHAHDDHDHAHDDHDHAHDDHDHAHDDHDHAHDDHDHAHDDHDHAHDDHDHAAEAIKEKEPPKTTGRKWTPTKAKKHDTRRKRSDPTLDTQVNAILFT